MVISRNTPKDEQSPAFPSLCLSFSLMFCLFVNVSFALSLGFFIDRSVYFLVYQTVCLSVCLSVGLSVFMFVFRRVDYEVTRSAATRQVRRRLGNLLMQEEEKEDDEKETNAFASVICKINN